MPPRKTPERFLEEMESMYGREYDVLEDYRGSMTPINFRHRTCGTTLTKTPNAILSGHRCFSCFGNKRKTTAEYAQYVREVSDGEYELIGEYINVATKTEFKHVACGNEYSTAPSVFNSGKRCPNCHSRRRRTTPEFIELLADVHGQEMTVLSPYINTHAPVLIHHEKCGQTFTPTPSAILKGHGCPHCISSSGEKAVAKVLDELCMKYKHEVGLPGCVHKRQLFFDFVVYGKNDDILLIIEYDGRQHFEAIDYFGGEDRFVITQKTDAIKNAYCEQRNLPLLRIRHDFNGDLTQLITNKLNDTEEF